MTSPVLSKPRPKPRPEPRRQPEPLRTGGSAGAGPVVAAAPSTTPGPLASFVRFVVCGGGVGLLSGAAVPLVATLIPWALANAVITVASTLVCTELHAFFTFGTGRRAGWRRHLQSAGSATAAYGVTCAAVFVLYAVRSSPGLVTQQAVYLGASALAGTGRFVVLRLFVFADRARSGTAEAPRGGAATPAATVPATAAPAPVKPTAAAASAAVGKPLAKRPLQERGVRRGSRHRPGHRGGQAPPGFGDRTLDEQEGAGVRASDAGLHRGTGTEQVEHGPPGRCDLRREGDAVGAGFLERAADLLRGVELGLRARPACRRAGGPSGHREVPLDGQAPPVVTDLSCHVPARSGQVFRVAGPDQPQQGFPGGGFMKGGQQRAPIDGVDVGGPAFCRAGARVCRCVSPGGVSVPAARTAPRPPPPP